MSRLAPLGLALLALTVTAPTAAQAEDVRVREDSRSALALTLYNGNLTMVEDQRRATLRQGQTTLVFEGVSSQMMPSSVLVSPEEGAAVVRLLAHDARVADRGSLLQFYEGREVTLVRYTASGEEIRQRAQVLRASPAPLFLVGGQVLTDWPGQIIFDSLPPTLPLVPTLRAMLGDTQAGEAGIALRYLTGGFSWQANHVLTLSADETRLSLQSMATIQNASGSDWPNAEVALTSVLINQVESPTAMPAMARGAVMMESAPSPMAMDMTPQRESIAGGYVYRLPQPLTLRNGESLQAGLVTETDIPARVVLESESGGYGLWGPTPGTQESHPSRLLFFTLPEETMDGGQPLPAGLARTYQLDRAGRVHFIGEDRLKNLPVGEEARLALGQSFDVIVKRTQTSHRRLSDRVMEVGQQIEVVNGGTTEAEVRVVDHLVGDWRVVTESDPSETLDASRLRWVLTIPAGESRTLTYTARITH